MTWGKRVETTRDNRGGQRWPAGPWDAEPDRVEWTTEAGLPGIILRQSRRPYGPGHLCGYVGVEPGHPWHGKDDQTAPEEAHEAAHGGITYGDECDGEVCHVPEPGQPEHLWWLGFDAAHSGDLRPQQADEPIFFEHGVYRDVEYMRRSVERLAMAAKAAAR
jgi:hypothetical protein